MQIEKSEMTSSDTISQAQRQMQKAALELVVMSNDFADSKQIIAYDSDRRKQALAASVNIFLDSGESAAAAEYRARGGIPYAENLTALAAQYNAALRVIEKYEATKILWESSRSLLSVEKAKIGLL